MTETTWDVVIIGGASAGLSAALMLGRARRRVLVLDTGLPRNRVAPHMHGVLGRDGTSPLQLVADGRKELERYGVQVRQARVTDVIVNPDGYTVVTSNGDREPARRVLIATGMRDRLPPIDGLAEQWGTGAVVCPYCDGWEVRDRRIAVIANDPLAPSHAQMLRQWSSDVTYFPRQEFLLGDDDRAQLVARGIRIDDREIARVDAAGGALRALVLADGSEFEVDSIFIRPVSTPIDEMVSSLGLVRSEAFGGSWITVDAMGKTSAPGVWAAGNVTNPGASVPVAMAAGTMAGAAINHDLIEDDIELALARASWV
jgi:thioredoxin reductase